MTSRSAARQRAEQLRSAAAQAVGEKREMLIADAALFDALSDELEAAEKGLKRAQRAVTTYYNDHVEDGEPPCPCDACAKARLVFAAALSSPVSPDTEATRQ